MEGKGRKPRTKKDQVFKLDTGNLPFSEVVKRVAKGGTAGTKPKGDHTER